MASLEELIAFNDEVVSLERAGIPVDLGLAELSPSPDIASSQINAALTRRVHAGVSLEDAVAEENPMLPSIYQSVVVAGLRCGRLPAAMEGLSRYRQSLLDIRQSLRSALVYPLIIGILAYVLFVGVCLLQPPEYYRMFADMGSDGGAVFRTVRLLHGSLPFWVAIPPVVFIAMLFWLQSSRSQTRSLRSVPRWFHWLPFLSRLAADQRYASLAELLALLVEHEVPLYEGLRLAARASGDRELINAAQQMSAAAEQGLGLTQDSPVASPFPPFLRWALTRSDQPGDLAPTLRLAAKTYRQRAEWRATWLRAGLPMLTCVVLAGGVTLLYCVSVFLPIIEFIQDLS